MFKVDEFEYFAPLSSPKPKHAKLKNRVDLVKIDNGKYGVVNLNNVIPISEKHYEIFDLRVLSKGVDERKR